MNNPNGFGGGSESGYGFNSNGTEMSRDEYLAEHSDMNDEAYERNYRMAEQEEEEEMREIYYAEDLKEAVKALKEDIARIDTLLEKTYAEIAKYEKAAGKQEIGKTAIESATHGDISSKSVGAENVAQAAVHDSSGAQPADRYVDSKNIVHTNLEDLRNAEEGYR